ncbi:MULTISPECIES: polysaccharide deacetylase family protein [Idiomarina]|uniref:polysaccharide deacetylase family protein n=1 Tax=Idiomarina TaxID=135575 RepID=UPI000C36BCF3|nr:MULTISPECIES: polysaccharide deacetylase family protein [Idiomarina]MBP59135.1 hypothetical protein [Idiomarina sp.]|tara:strand:+ start:19416 stop:20774 length:1359 start_codon:yes stop_codon:yes gene_type:complete
MSLFTGQALNWLCLILEERFGHSFELTQSHNALKLTLTESSRGYILFPKLEEAFHQSCSDSPCSQWCASSEGWHSALNLPLPAPCVSELARPLIKHNQDHVVINYDILGLTYWMLNRIEEIGRTDLDEHERFPAVASHAYRYGYLERPIIDEWMIILGQVINKIWPNSKLKKHKFQIKVSHDVDEPARYAFQNLKGIIKKVSGDLIIRRDFKSLINGPVVWLNSGKDIHKNDPLNTFDWLMEQSEKNGLTSAFYFICGRTDKEKDARYDPEMSQIRSLMRKISRRGHEIGLHPSYNTYNQPDKIKLEFQRLKKICAEENIVQDEWGGRMHFLRWNQAITPRAWSDAGMSYDSTLSYADNPGFRCGTCFEYPGFDIVTQKKLALRIRPLIAMEGSVISKTYLGLGSTEEAYEKFSDLKSKCKKVNGVFSLLWHNSFFRSPMHYKIYSRLIRKS